MLKLKISHLLVLKKIVVTKNFLLIEKKGRSFGLCPPGWILDDTWKNCIDIDECADRTVMEKLNVQCRDGCENTPGSYKCLENFEFDIRLTDDDELNEEENTQNVLCPDGFEYNTTSQSCAGTITSQWQ